MFVGIATVFLTGIFKISSYLCTQGDVPTAHYLQFESLLYPGNYIRWHDDETVDCEVRELFI